LGKLVFPYSSVYFYLIQFFMHAFIYFI